VAAATIAILQATRPALRLGSDRFKNEESVIGIIARIEHSLLPSKGVLDDRLLPSISV
jgi:hypothetical protein